jgi:hypothetical protein
MRHYARFSRRKFERTEEIENSLLTLNDREEVSFGTGATYWLKQTLGFTVDGTIRQSEAVDTGVTTDAWDFIAGVQIQRPRINGYFGAGFGQAESDNNKRNNFLLDANLNYLTSRGVRLGGFVNRRYSFSILADNATRLTTQGGFRFSVPMVDRYSLVGSYTIGQNDYGDSLISGRVVEQDTFQRADLGVNIRILHYLSVRPGIFYFKRDTDIPELNKEAFGYFITMGVGYVLEF